MADAYYPHDYLPMPRQEGYAFQPVSPIKRTELSTGRARQRRAYTSTPTQVSVSWLFETDVQGQIFEAWFKDVLKDGSLWFQMKLQTPLGVEDHKCRFIDIYTGPVLSPPIHWLYSAEVELWSRAVLDGGYGEHQDFIRNSDILDRALNREWPAK
ncbi:hypothetical protein Q2S52_002226 [Escherichia coli]|uniref:hypothetical protein n=1 Tax=Escherichia coli TaxID=562 RepID=UPI000BEAB82A|nr:hypothetical protein [Escherichia coli]EAT6751244.1 hypothetical protein [Salmonella enterica]EFB9392274.1 hypothetical protein [Escherichia coli]EHA7283023.1 hypothetical protein [Salmonella enterica]ELM8902286.1 hypothetical protein [Escherichia coli]